MRYVLGHVREIECISFVFQTLLWVRQSSVARRFWELRLSSAQSPPWSNAVALENSSVLIDAMGRSIRMINQGEDGLLVSFRIRTGQ